MGNTWNGARVRRPQCGSCGSMSVMTIQLAHEGEPVSVQYCADCERREWIKDGESVGLDTVIPASQLSNRPRRR